MVLYCRRDIYLALKIEVLHWLFLHQEFNMSHTTLLPQQESSFTFFLSLISGRLKPGKLWYDRKYRIKYLVRSLIPSCVQF